MIDLDKAIKHCEDVAKEKRDEAQYIMNFYDESRLLNKEEIAEAKECYECAKEHDQLADWLEELEILREAFDLLVWMVIRVPCDGCCEHGGCPMRNLSCNDKDKLKEQIIAKAKEKLNK